MSEQHLTRFGVSMDKELLNKFDKLIETKGYKNRSEAVRDLVRDALVKQTWEDDNQFVAGSILIFYDHHQRNLIEEITEIQHDFGSTIKSSLHIHLDQDICLEVVVLRGEGDEVRKAAEKMMTLKGVKHVKLTTTSLGKEL